MIYNRLWKFHHICNFGAVGGKNETDCIVPSKGHGKIFHQSIVHRPSGLIYVCGSIVSMFVSMSPVSCRLTENRAPVRLHCAPCAIIPVSVIGYSVCIECCQSWCCARPHMALYSRSLT